jgi:hypothetical protein
MRADAAVAFLLDRLLRPCVTNSDDCRFGHFSFLIAVTQPFAGWLPLENEGFVTDDWVGAVDLTTLERVHSSHISTDLREREDDMLWRLRWQGTWLYVYLLLEFQSAVDTFMAVRIQTYVGLLYEGLIRSRQLTPSGMLPPVVPIVLYNGRGAWTAALEVAELIEAMPGGLTVY